MYPPRHHQEYDKEKMIAVIQQYPLGMLISVADGKPLITHTPIIYQPNTGKLVAHIDRNNPQVTHLQDNDEVTVVFKGPDTYISPSIYSTTQLPTYNYIIVHLTGKVTPIRDLEYVKQTLIAMTRFLEGETPKYILHPNNERMNGLLNYIHTFEIEITGWEGKFKLSQDKKEQDFLAAKEALLQNTRRDISTFIERIYD
ncbi:MAG TPA: FMN-binding negative transcriptional regulator [Flavobacteriaceae bacterium]|nr:FMN-binding negative transcriptional regulator [Flavobacteriaceae bacterium]